MNPEIKNLSEKKLIGKNVIMSLSENKTFELWQSFMKRRKEIKNNISADLFSIQVFDSSFNFEKFNPQSNFTKWAAVEVTDFNSLPQNMESFTLKSGLYAVFIHKGTASDGEKTFRYIFETWIPNSQYIIDNRPHFEILGENYSPNDINSEEEVWIPIKRRE